MSAARTYGEAIGRLIRVRRERAGWSMLELAIEAFEDETKVRRITDLENGYVPRPQAKTLGPIFETLNISEEDVLRCKELPTVAPQAQGALGLTTENLEELSGIFEIDKPDAPVDELLEFLKDQANDLRKLRKRMAKLQTFEDTKSNALSAAQDAVDSRRFLEADEILAACEEIQETERTLVQVNQQADIRATRGSTALLSRDVKSAAHHFRTAASYLEPFDSLAAHSRRYEYASAVFEFGERYGKGAEEEATAILESGDLSKVDQIDARFSTDYRYLLARSLEITGRRSGASEGTAKLIRAVELFRQSISFYVAQKNTKKGARALNSMGIALWKLGERTTGRNGLAYFQKSTKAHLRALRAARKEHNKTEEAKILGNLGLVQWAWGERADTNLSRRLLDASIVAQRRSLALRSQQSHPLDWARTKNNLGLALQARGERDQASDGKKFLIEATKEFQDALLIRTFEDHPFAWAMTENNIGLAKRALGERLSDKEGAAAILEAITHFRNATKYHCRADFPYDWAICKENLAESFLSLSQKLKGPESTQALSDAFESIDDALSEYDPIEMEYDHGTASELKAKIVAEIKTKS